MTRPMPKRARPTPRPRRWNERGMVGGGDGLIFGILILLAGSLAFVNIWSIVDTRAALDAASREFLRTYSEQPTVDEARLFGELSARESMERRGNSSKGLTIEVDQPSGFGPCAAVTVRLSMTVHWFRVPFLTSVGASRLTIQNRELIDANSEVTADVDYDATTTPCFED